MSANEIFQQTMDSMAKAFSPVAKPTLPKAPRNDDECTVEDETCTLHCEYVAHDYGDADDAPDVEIVAIQADFGGREWVTVPIQCFSGDKLNELESLCRDHCAEQDHNRGQYARDFPEGEE